MIRLSLLPNSASSFCLLWRVVDEEPSSTFAGLCSFARERRRIVSFKLTLFCLLHYTHSFVKRFTTFCVCRSSTLIIVKLQNQWLQSSSHAQRTRWHEYWYTETMISKLTNHPAIRRIRLPMIASSNLFMSK